MNKQTSCVNSPSVSLSFEETLNFILDRSEFDEVISLDPDNGIYFDLCLIMTEIERRPDEHSMKINNSAISLADIKSVLSLVRSEHLQQIAINYEKINYPIKNKKAYLTAALYNSVFELSATMTNTLRAPKT